MNDEGASAWGSRLGQGHVEFEVWTKPNFEHETSSAAYIGMGTLYLDTSAFHGSVFFLSLVHRYRQTVCGFRSLLVSTNVHGVPLLIAFGQCSGCQSRLLYAEPSVQAHVFVCRRFRSRTVVLCLRKRPTPRHSCIIDLLLASGGQLILPELMCSSPIIQSNTAIVWTASTRVSRSLDLSAIAQSASSLSTQVVKPHEPTFGSTVSFRRSTNHSSYIRTAALMACACPGPAPPRRASARFRHRPTTRN